MSKLFIQCNKDSFCEHIIGGANISLYGCVSILVPEYAMCLCMCVVCVCVYQIRVQQKKHIICQMSVNLMPCCIKHSSRSETKDSTFADP